MKRLQNRVAQSRFTLPVTVAYGLAIWVAAGLVPKGLYAEFLAFSVSVYLMVELNNSNALIRTYSRLVSCSFLALTCMMPFLLDNLRALLVQLCVVVAYTLLFKCYQDKAAIGKAYYAFLALGAASTVLPEILAFAPILWILMGTKLMAISFRMVAASVLGILTPYWFLAGYHVLAGDIAELAAGLDWGALAPEPFRYDGIDVPRLASFAILTLLSLVGAAHFLHNSYEDKIRTRMVYETLVIMDLAMTAMVAILPRTADLLLGAMAVHTAALIAHFLALTSSRATNAAFIAIALLVLGATLCNLPGTFASRWIPPLPF